jgi:serine protease
MVTDIGDPGKDWDFGHGLLNAPRAVAAALAAAGDPDGPRAVLHVSAHALDFGTEFSSLPFDISNQGGGELLVESVISDQPWLILDPGAIGSNRVRVDRSAAALGVNWGALHVFSNVGSVEVTVRLEVVPPEALGDVGTVVVALVDSASGAVVRAQQTTHSEDYRFTFDDPPAGELRVVFGTDWAETGLLGLPGDLLGSLPFGDGRLCLGQASEPACLNPAQAQALLGAAEFVTSPGATWAY